jgi:hypothetical protein
MRGVYERSVWEECMGGVYGRGVWEECMGGVYGRSVWEECMGGVYGRSVWEECMGGVYGRSVWGESIVYLLSHGKTTRAQRKVTRNLPTVVTKDVQSETVETRRMFARSRLVDSTAEAQKLPPWIRGRIMGEVDGGRNGRWPFG